MKYKVNKDKCIGCGMCVSITNETVFKFDTDGLAKADNNKITDENKDQAEEAFKFCPGGAIEEMNE